MKNTWLLCSFLGLLGCGGSVPPEVSSFPLPDALTKAKACAIVGYQQAVGPIATDERARAEAAVAGEFSRARFREVCYWCPPTEQNTPAETPACPGRAWSCLVAANASGFPVGRPTVAVIAIYEGLPRATYATGEPLIHELLHVLAVGRDPNHLDERLWRSLGGEGSAQAIAQACFARP